MFFGEKKIFSEMSEETKSERKTSDLAESQKFTNDNNKEYPHLVQVIKPNTEIEILNLTNTTEEKEILEEENDPNTQRCKTLYAFIFLFFVISLAIVCLVHGLISQNEFFLYSSMNFIIIFPLKVLDYYSLLGHKHPRKQEAMRSLVIVASCSFVGSWGVVALVYKLLQTSPLMILIISNITGISHAYVIAWIFVPFGEWVLKKYKKS